MFATGKRDGHPDEPADGHLGGLDVDIEVVDSAGGVEEMLAQVWELVEREHAEVVSGVVPSERRENIRRQAEGTLTILIAPNGDPPSHIRPIDDRPFAVAFEQVYRYMNPKLFCTAASPRSASGRHSRKALRQSPRSNAAFPAA